MDYVITDGLNLLQPVNVPGYPAPADTEGLRNLAGKVNEGGAVTIYAR